MVPRTRHIKIAHLYPEAMDLYGDSGNVRTLVKRCQWRGLEAEVVEVYLGEAADLGDVDLIFIGGGQDSAQGRVARDIVRHTSMIRDLVDGGAAALAICGGFQLFGSEYLVASGATLPGIGVFDAWTLADRNRVIGEITTEVSLQLWNTEPAPPPIVVVGFENHAGRTFLGSKESPFGRVVHGGGNLGDGSVEGAVYRNAIGTYLHGPLLPRNPQIADHLIRAALTHRYGPVGPLPPLDDVAELNAHSAAMRRPARRQSAERIAFGTR
jgi:lipid II isoglutaminyl synthase (glutamine-hydrolysing)